MVKTLSRVLVAFFLFTGIIIYHKSNSASTICGIRVEEIKDPLMQKIRYLDKLIDVLAKGKPMDKILRV
ncbi:DUF2200 family protein [Roseburia hominis]